MHKRPLGKSSVQISPLMLGTWAIGGARWGGTNEADAIAAIQMSIDQGIDTIDTAPVYGFGLSEELIAKAIRGRREKVIIATKCGLLWAMPEGYNDHTAALNPTMMVPVVNNCTKESIVFECEQSLKRLNIDVIDLYQIHWPDPATPLEESWSAMVKLKEQGKVRAIGVSNFNLEQLKTVHALYPVDSLQSPFSLIHKELQEEILPFCQQQQIAVLAYSPLERGLLTGKVSLERQFKPGDHRQEKEEFSLENRKKILEKLQKIVPIAEKHHATLAQVVLQCTLHRPGITAAIVGARNPSQALENAQALLLELSSQEKELVFQAF
jgi:aryl-alcohol dehydrogenase-like predicted oxidoreductase